MSLWPDRSRASNVEVEYIRTRFELVARARWVWDEDPGELRKVASTISSLKPTTCRRGRPDEIE
jgi:hypothetical protein